MTLVAGTKLGPFEIRSPLGAGGMGEVYRATDTNLGRDVALKVLPAEMAHDPVRLARFRREAKTLAQLDHPNIVTIYSVEECDGVHFLTMQLVEGQALDRLIPAGGLPVEQIVEIAGALGDALAAAHEKGIVHRDLKPANVMVSNEGRVKVLDFGLAKDVSASDPADATLTSDHRTQAGLVMGTPAYMSPEQTSGRPLDHRTDIFSLGVLLHEMATGRRPFVGSSSAELVSAILRDTAPPVTDARPDLPSDLARIVRRCLEKDPRHRVQTARDVSNEFRDLARQTSQRPAVHNHARALAHEPPAAREASGAARVEEGFWIAVIPFKSSGDAEMESFAVGLAEDITTGLSRFRYLSVVASTAAVRMKEAAGDERAVGSKLGARYLLEGSIRKGGSAIRLNAQLIDAQTGEQLWAEAYNRDLGTSSLFAAQDDLAARIVATVADSYGVLVHSIRAAMRRKDDVDLTPVEWQFQYFAYREQITPAAHAALKSRLERVVGRDDRRSDLWACLAQIYLDEYAFGFRADATSLDRALAAARGAVEFDRANQFALVALAQVHFFRRDLAAFGPAAERAMALNPLNTDAIGILGLQIVHTGEFERGTVIVRRAMELNANHAGWMHFAPLWEHFHKGEYEQAIECANRVDVPGLFWPFLVVAAACGHLGRRGEAEAAVRDLLALDPEFAVHARSNIESWHFASGLLEPLLEGLRKAGLAIPATDESPHTSRLSGTVTERADRAEPDMGSGAARAEEGFWVAVLPFKYSGGNADLTALADGLSEDIVTGLSRFSYLRVIARSSTSRFANQAIDIRSAGKELGARYVMEGSLRQAGSKLRLAVQLVDATSGAHLWAENYERDFQTEAIFALQDDLVPRIVSTVADQYGILPRSMSEALRSKSEDQLTPHEAVLRTFSYFERVTPEEHAAMKRILERAVKNAPDQADCWAMLSMIYRGEFAQGFNAEPDPLGRAIAAAQRAVDLAPTDALGYFALATSLFFRKERLDFRVAAERAIALNRMDGSTVAFMGLLMAAAGDWDHGCELVESAMQLNPRHPGWFHIALFSNAYRQGKYAEALEAALRINMPGYFHTHSAKAAALGQLGQREAARKAVQDLLALRPDFAAAARTEYAKWMDPELVEHIVDGLRKAGLEVPNADATSVVTKPLDSGAIRADEGFWVAVLPFKYSGGNADLTALAEGITEDVVTGLSRFSYLRVIARSSTARYAGEAADVRSAGKELGARYVMEGSLRQAGTKLRLAVQLVDATTGAHLWAENYERIFSPETVFELQDDLVPRIVSTVADTHGVLPRSMSEALRSRAPEQLSPYEAVLRSFGYWERVTPEDLAAALSGLESAVQKAPAYADAWAMLALLCVQEYGQGFNLQPDSLASGLAAARRAVEAGPSNHLAYCSLAQALFFQKEFQSCRNAAERAIALNPVDGNSIAFLGEILTYAGDWERGLELSGRAKQLNPTHPGWYWYADFYNAYRQGDYRGALGFARKFNMPNHWGGHALMVAVCGQLGERDAADKALRDLLKLRPGFAATVRRDLEKWWNPEYEERMIEGWRKAGLEIAPEEGAGVPAVDGSHSSTQNASGTVRADEGFWVAVLPFKYSGSNADLTALAEGLTEDIVTGLSRFSYLRVIARSSTSRYANQSVDVRTAGKELGARYVMEGSLRQAGSKLRLAVQLVDAVSGAHLWAENYERSFSSEAVFELQDDLVPRIVSTVADGYGVLPYSMSDLVRSKALDQLTPYEAVVRSMGYGYRITPEEHALARTCLEWAVQQAPGYADGWAVLSLLYADEYGFGFNAQPDPLGRALQAARRAADAAPSNSYAQAALAKALFFRKEFQAFRTAAEQAIALNPMNGATLANLGSLLAYSGDWERGCALTERAVQLNPRHPAWYWFPLAWNAYRQGDYRGALNLALKINLPGFYATYELLAMVYGQLGERDAASQALGEMLKLLPNFGKIARAMKSMWFTPEMVEHVLDGLRKAGLEIADGSSMAPAKTEAETFSKAVSIIPSIAILPFANMSADKDQEYFSDGLAEEIINLLAQVGGLKVIARTSSFAFRGKEEDIRKIADTLNVTHVLEGSVRRSGNRIRVTAQLIAAADGTHLWSERYDRELSDIFAVQDEMSAAIAGALRVKLSREAAPQRYVPKVVAYEAYLKARYLSAKVTPESLELAKQCYEQAIEFDPAFGLAHVGLGYYWIILTHFGRCPAHEAVPAARAAVGRALQIDSSLPDAHALLGFLAATYDMDWAAAERHFDFPLAKQEGFAFIRPMYGWFQFVRGNVEQAIELARRTIADDPLEVWPRMNLHAYLQAAGRDTEALEQLKKVLELDENQVVALVSMAMIHADQGDLPQALVIARRAYATGPWLPDTIGVLAALLRRNGDEAESQSLAQTLGSGEALGDARARALFHLLCGELDVGADWVEKAVEERDASMMVYLRFVVCKGLRASRRWPKIAKMMNLPVGS